MMNLHDNKDLFKEILTTVSEKTGYSADIIEKDYYVTMILKKLADSEYNFVFKGGTSLSKAYHVIDRFSEDIDITFEEHIGEGRRKKIKYDILKPLENALHLRIKNFCNIESDKDYNHYDFYYESVCDDLLNKLPSFVKLETALMSYAFPVESKLISNYIFDSIGESEKEIIDKYDLYPFNMLVQSLERTLVDKIFALCDYYMLNRPKRNSRHLYDIYMISKHVDMNKIIQLIPVVREHRSKIKNNLSPSSSSEINIKKIFYEFIDNDFYKNDFNETTKRLVIDNINYELITNDIKKFIETVL